MLHVCEYSTKNKISMSMRQPAPQRIIRIYDLNVNTSSESESDKFTGDTPNDIISPGGSDGGEISPLNAGVKGHQ